MTLLTLGSCFLCAIISFCFILNAYKNKKQGITGNQAQYAISVGVLFTFLGISVALYFFDTSNIASSIDTFLSGMKTAFYTSIIGMFSALIIKAMQSGIDSVDEEEYKKGLSNIDDISRELRTNTSSLILGLRDIKNSIDSSSTSIVSEEISKLSAGMKCFVDTVNTSQTAMSRMVAGMEAQSTSLKELSTVLSTSMESLVNSQEQMITSIGRIMDDSIIKLGTDLSSQITTMREELTQNLSNLNTNLTHEISNSSSVQIELLKNMDQSIMAMKENSAQAANDSSMLLAETRQYQMTSLENEAKQNIILNDNTQSIVGMKEAFDGFVNNVKEVFGEAVIGALNRSMQNLNDQLEKQFGENFKELNAAVKALNDWQQDYKEIVDDSIVELKYTNSVFTQFTDVVSKNVVEHIDSLNHNLELFTKTSKDNIEIQSSLTATTEQLANMIVTAQENIQDIQMLFSNFKGFSKEVTESLDIAMNNHKDIIISNLYNIGKAIQTVEEENKTAILEAGKTNVQALNASAYECMQIMTDTTNELANSADQIKNSALSLATDTTHYLDRFGETSDNVLNKIGDILESFNADFKTKTAEAVANLEGLFEVMSKNANDQQKKAITTLAAQLETITERMIYNYSAIVEKIAEVDALILQNGGRRG